MSSGIWPADSGLPANGRVPPTRTFLPVPQNSPAAQYWRDGCVGLYGSRERKATISAEATLMEEGQFKGKRGGQYRVSLLTKWDHGKSFSDEERELIQFRTKQALIFMGVPHLVR